MKIKLYANPQELNDYLNGVSKTFKASYDHVTPEQTEIMVDTDQAFISEDAVENVDVTPATPGAIELI